MTNRIIQLSAVVVVVLAGLAPARAASREEVVQAIKDSEARWVREIAAKNLEKTVAHYADDAVVMSPEMAPAAGKEAIRALMKAMMADPSLSFRFQTQRVEVAAGGEMASSQGSFQITMTDAASGKPVTASGSYVTVYKKVGSEWKAVFDIATSGPAAEEGKK